MSTLNRASSTPYTRATVRATEQYVDHMASATNMFMVAGTPVFMGFHLATTSVI